MTWTYHDLIYADGSWCPPEPQERDAQRPVRGASLPVLRVPGAEQAARDMLELVSCAQRLASPTHRVEWRVRAWRGQVQHSELHEHGAQRPAGGVARTQLLDEVEPWNPLVVPSSKPPPAYDNAAPRTRADATHRHNEGAAHKVHAAAEPHNGVRIGMFQPYEGACEAY
ncbi:hypothetical protein CYMTET_43237 [Cymbomonas tetramitiformis]|uniref:Uncharacterized protein n=1 Tax=Cymbomonas tetramitiformis TaxID=36881 RepID=A0AAE0C4H0_9CHLO|nr:hypothetical protein CYMTET_43237 [Cymbomonas tetramitiformis]